MMSPLHHKILAHLLQLPPSLSTNEGSKKLEVLIHMLNPDLRYATDVRNTSWIDNKEFCKFYLSTTFV
jgi:uncharacterized protein YecE (DUF72 family)